MGRPAPARWFSFLLPDVQRFGVASSGACDSSTGPCARASGERRVCRLWWARARATTTATTTVACLSTHTPVHKVTLREIRLPAQPFFAGVEFPHLKVLAGYLSECPQRAGVRTLRTLRPLLLTAPTYGYHILV
jgi:hypothetical protein